MEATATSLKILIVDDHEFTRTGLRYSLQAKFPIEVVGECENGADAITLVESLKPNMVLMDIGMPVLNGVLATQQIKQRFPEVKVIILTSRQIPEEVYAALAAGADAYCMKDISTDRLVHVMNLMAEGAIWLDPAIARQVVKALPTPETSDPPPVKKSQPLEPLQTLTKREMEVLELIAQGKSNKHIAESLCISTHTVKIHVRNLIQKLAVDDRTQMAVKALQSGIVQLNQHE